MKNPPETPKQQPKGIEQPKRTENEHTILSSSEIGALSPRVPRRPEFLQQAPKPIESRITDKDGNQISYLPESVGEFTPNTSIIKKGDRAKQPLTFKGRTKDHQIVLETEDDEGFTVTQPDFQKGYERLQQVYIEKTKDGQREIQLNLETTLQESIGFYITHDLKDFLKELPKEIKLSPQSETRLREALREGFDKAILLPSTELQKGNIDKLLIELADKKLPGLQDAEQYNQKHYIHQPDVTKNAISRNRPTRKAYLLLYQSNPIPNETKGKSPNELDPLFTQKNWNGLTLEEYLILQRKETETNKDHRFDTYDDDPNKSQWTWLLDSRVSGVVVRADWYPKNRQVRVSWYRPGYSYDGLGTRPAVVVEVGI